MDRQAGWLVSAVLVLAGWQLVGCGGDSNSTSSCSVSEMDDGTAVIECDDGSSATVEPGEDGMLGTPGESCTVSELDGGGAVIECEDGSSVTVPPGTPGEGGDAGPPGASGADFGVAGVGLDVVIEAAEVDDERHPVLTLTLKDSTGVGLDASGILSSGEFSIQFNIASVPVEQDGEAGPYVNYIVDDETQQPSRETQGEWTLLDASEGRFTYRYDTRLPEDYGADLTHVASIAARRSMPDGVAYVANATFFFVPEDPDAETLTREVASTETCNTCHNPLSLHGGRRQDYQVCLTCHTQGAIDPETGHSIDFREMVHKIHMGASLPSVMNGNPYILEGYGTADFSEVSFPQDTRNCAACHTGENADWLDTRPSIEACGSCHDDVWFGPTADKPNEEWVVNHPGGPKAPDTCVNCHTVEATFPGCNLSPGGSTGCDSYSVHYNEFTDPDATKFVADELEVSAAALDAAPVLRFRARKGTHATDATTPVTDPTELTRLRVVVAGPNGDYANDARIQYNDPALTDEGEGVYSTTLPETWTAIATQAGADPAVDSLTFSLRAGLSVNVGAANEYTAYTINPVAEFTMNSAEDSLVTRRAVVSDERCNTCHEDIGYTHHRGAYRTVTACNVCHTPSEGTPPRLGPLVHDLHANEVLYPGDPRDCESCHLPDTYGVGLPEGVLPTDFGTPSELSPATSFCTGCHSAPATLTHAQLNTRMGDEACVACHGDGKAFGVDTVHARPEYE